MIADYPFKNQIKYVTSQLTGDYYEQAIVTVQNRVNYNEVKFYNPFSWVGYVRYDQVELIMNSYYNLVDQGAREYSAYDALQGETTVWQLIKAVAKVAGQTDDLTRKVLDQLEYATADGTIKTAQYIKPKTYQDFKVTREKPDAVQTFSGWLGSNIIWIAALAGGIYVAKKTGLLDKGLAKIKSKVNEKKKPNTKGLNDKHSHKKIHHKKTHKQLSDTLFGKEPDVWTFYKAGGDAGITKDLDAVRKKHFPDKVFVVFSSPNHEEVEKRYQKYKGTYGTMSLFDKRTKSKLSDTEKKTYNIYDNGTFQFYHNAYPNEIDNYVEKMNNQAKAQGKRAVYSYKLRKNQAVYYHQLMKNK